MAPLSCHCQLVPGPGRHHDEEAGGREVSERAWTARMGAMVNGNMEEAARACTQCPRWARTASRKILFPAPRPGTGRWEAGVVVCTKGPFLLAPGQKKRTRSEKFMTRQEAASGGPEDVTVLERDHGPGVMGNDTRRIV